MNTNKTDVMEKNAEQTVLTDLDALFSNEPVTTTQQTEDENSKKYEIVKDAPDWEIIKINDHKLYPIRALKNFGKVRKGWYGGHVEREANLSQKDNSWVDRWAMVYGNACVYENAYIADGACVYGNAKVYGNAVVEHGNDETVPEIYGNAEVYGSAHVVHDAKIYGEAKICCNADIRFGGDYIVIQGLSKGRITITAFRDSTLGIAVNTPTFYGSLEEFETKIKETYGGNDKPEFVYLEKEYTAAAEFIKAHFADFHYNA